jgi:hypothetical protein
VIQGPAVAAGSAFAVCQSAAMGGAGLAVVNGVVAGTAAAALGGGFAKEALMGDEDNEKSHGGDNGYSGHDSKAHEPGVVSNDQSHEERDEEKEDDESLDGDQNEKGTGAAQDRSKL